MESAIRYVLIVFYGGKPHITNHSNQLEQMHRWLVQEKQDCSAFRILGAQRYVISASGKVTATDVRIDFDEGGLEIHDRYGSLLDSYSAPEPGKKRFKVTRYETWANSTVVDADSAEETQKAVDQMVQDGGFDVLDGWCEEVWYEVTEEGE